MATKKYLDSTGLQYLWQKIGLHFITPKADSQNPNKHDLTQNGIVIGSNGKREVEAVAPGTSNQYLRTPLSGTTKPEWVSPITVGSAITSGNTTMPTAGAVYEFVGEQMTKALVYKGTVGTGGTVTTLPDTHKVGDVYIVQSSGTYAGHICEPGDMIVANTTRTSGTSLDSEWDVINGENQVQTPTDATTADTWTTTLGAPGTRVTIAEVDGKRIPVATPSNWAVSDTLYKLSAGRSSASLGYVMMNKHDSTDKTASTDTNAVSTKFNVQFTGNTVSSLATQVSAVTNDASNTAYTMTLLTEDLGDHKYVNTTYSQTAPASTTDYDSFKLKSTQTTNVLSAFTGTNRWSSDEVTGETTVYFQVTDQGHYAPSTEDTGKTQTASAVTPGSTVNLANSDGTETATGHTDSINVISSIKLDKRNHVVGITTTKITADIISLTTAEIDAATDLTPNSSLATA